MADALPVRKDKVAPATVAIELLPGTLGLGEPVGDGVDDCRMMAEAAVAAVDLDVLDLGPVLVQAGLPGADAIRAAEEIEVVGTCGGSASVSRRYCSSILRPLTIS